MTMTGEPMLAALSRAIDDRGSAMIGFLKQIVNMDSPTEDKGLGDRVGDVLQAKAESLGMTCARDAQTSFADNRICRLAPRNAATGLPRVLLIGHFDTVYAAGVARERPFRTADDMAFGPGVLDMKGGLTVGLFALEALREVLGDLPFAATFIFNSDEEIGSPRSRTVIVDEAKRHDLALVLEPGRSGPAALVTRRKGVGIFHLEIEGVEAHAGAEPEKGANAILEAAHKTLAISELNDPAAGTIVTPGVVAGGTKPYVVPGACRLSIDSRVPSLQEQARVTSGLQAIAARSRVARTRARLEGGFHRPPMEPSEAALKHVALMQRVSRLLGFPLGTATTGGASDGNLTAAAGTPTIDGLGPHGARAHSPEEYIELPSLAAKCKVLAGFLASLEPARPDDAETTPGAPRAHGTQTHEGREGNGRSRPQ